ncbi:hypothetical protein HK105_200446 [Polyrhizophydium stewartii]|uniref:Uncharacterized protein n=1 Tax=Polyrhizophydium stewartii TaxID=2732419 RepID=A0ABR4NLF3_9FUNG
MDVGADADTNAIGLGDGGDARADAPILAISSRGGITGAACFDPATSTLSLLEDVSEDSAFSVCQMLLFQTNPGIVIANMRADAAMLAVLREPLRLSATTQHKIETRPSSEFAFEAGKTRLLGIRLARPNTPNRIDEQTHTHAHARSAAPTAAQRRESMQMTIEAVVCLDNREMVGAAGALLAFVAEAAFSGELALMDRPPRLPGVAEDVDAGFDAAGPAGEAAYGGAGRANLPYRARRGGRRAAALSLDGFVIHAVESIALSKMMQLSVNTLV